MRKPKFLLLLIISCALLFICGCSSKIDSPSDINIDENYLLTWNKVNDAASYEIKIKYLDTDEIANIPLRRTDYPLSTLEEGDYRITIKSLAGYSSDKDSDWSEPIFFHKDYETGCIYKLINGNTEYQVESAGIASGSIIIEDYYRNKPVTKIADGAFNRSIIENIVIGNNVRTIGKHAFYSSTKLESVTIPDSVSEIGSAAFNSCNMLKSITLPKNLTIIQENTFAYCRGLTQVNFGSNVMRIMDSAFTDCSNLLSVTLPDSVVSIENYAFASKYDEKSATNSSLTEVSFGKNLTSIGSYAFFNCINLKSVNFNKDSNLLTIGSNAFNNCKSLTEMSLPDTLTTIGSSAFVKATNLLTINIPDSVTKIGSSAFVDTMLYTKALEAEEHLVYAGRWLVYASVEFKEAVETINENTFSVEIVGIADQVLNSCKLLYIVTLPQSLKYIGDRAFTNNQTMYRVNIPNNSVEVIGTSAFSECPSLSVVIMGNGIKKIEEYAFYGCSRLDNSTIEGASIIPESVTSIGFRAFFQTALWENNEDGIVYAGNWVVGHDSAVSSVVLKGNTVGIADLAFYGCESLSSITGIYNVRYLGKGAFYGCINLASVELNINLREIKAYTFYNCVSLFRIELPFNLISIGRSAFYNCELLSDINLEGTVIESIGQFAFYRCKNIKEVKLGNKLISIGDYAFLECISITDINIPDSVKTIGTRAFYKCELLSSLTIGSSVSKIGNNAFSGCTSLSTVDIPSSLKEIGNFAFFNCTGITKLTFNNGLERIGDYAFFGLLELKTVSFPESLVSIGKFAFTACNSLSSVNINSSITYIDAHAFYACYNTTFYMDAKSSPQGWNGRWNSSFRPVIFGCVFSEDNSYIVSVNIEENTMLNINAINGINAPERTGFIFSGWTTNPDEQVIDFSAQDVALAQLGATLYSVWTINQTE